MYTIYRKKQTSPGIRSFLARHPPPTHRHSTPNSIPPALLLQWGRSDNEQVLEKDNLMKQQLWIVLGLVALVAVSVALPFKTPAAAQDAPPVLVRFIHAFPADSPFDVYVDGSLVVSGLGYGEATPHLRFPSGEAQVDVRVSGSDAGSPSFASRAVSLVTTSIGYGQVALVVQPDAFNQPTIAKTDDLLSPTNLGQGRLHMIHAAPQAGPVDVVLADGAQFIRDAAFNTIIGTVDPPAGQYEFLIVPAGTTSGTALLAMDPVTIHSGFLHTILLMPEAGGLGLTVTVIRTPVMADPAAETALVQIGHGGTDGRAFDVYGNDVLLFPNLMPGDVLPHTPFPAGDITLSLREAGSSASLSPAYEQTLTLGSDAEAVSLISLGALEDGTFTFGMFENDLAGLSPDMARVLVVNGTSNGPLTLSIDGTTLANTLPPTEAADPVDLAVDVYALDGLVDDAEAGGPLTVLLPDQPLIGGAWITVLAYTPGEPALSLATTPLLTGPNSLPGYVFVEPPTPTPTLPPPTVAAQTTATSLPLVTQPAPGLPSVDPRSVEAIVLALVNLDTGANLQCREYPTPQARSLGLIPNGSELVVLGYAGPVDPDIGEPFTPLEEGAFIDIETATDFEEIWLRLNWIDPERGPTDCWTRADFLVLTAYRRGTPTLLATPEALFEYAVLDDAALEAIPANLAGGPAEGIRPVIAGPTATTPTIAPPPTTGTIIGRVAGETPLLDVPEGGILTTLLPGATVQILGRDAAGAWLNVRYEVIGEGATTGWLPMTVVEITTPGITVESLPVVG